MSVNQQEGSASVLSQTEREAYSVTDVPPQEEISLLDLFIVLARYRWFIFKITACTIGAAIILSLILPIKYTATTSILPPQQGSSAGSALMAQLSSGL